MTDRVPGLTQACLLLLGAWGVIGFVGLVRPASVFVVGRVLLPLGAVVGLALALVALAGIKPRSFRSPVSH